MWPRRHQVDQRDLQGNILCGYGDDFGYAVYLFVQVGNAGAGRAWLGRLADQVTSAASWGDSGYKPLSTLNVALTAQGLERIGLPEPILRTFPEEFRQGMAEPWRADFLGDVGDSRPEEWDKGLEPGQPHILVTVTARDHRVLRRRWELLREDVEATAGLRIVHEQETAVLDYADPGLLNKREHFGFADGFSQPAIRGNGGPDTRKGMGTPRRLGLWSELAPGEFVLGYPGEDGLPPAAPVEPLGRSGSFMVVRKLHQHVGRFAAYVREMVEQSYKLDAQLGDVAGGVGEAVRDELGEEVSDLTIREQWVAGKIVGRWRDGRSLVLSNQPLRKLRRDQLHSEQRDELHSERINRFRYDPDPDGFGCPLGAHVRRANPRDSLGWQGRLTKRHRIIRRSMPYGERAFDPALAPDKAGGLFDVPEEDDPGTERGLMFVCFQASIARQFEVIQGRWLNDGDAFWLGNERDFLTISANGSGPDGASDSEDPLDAGNEIGWGRMTLQGEPPRFLSPQPSFVTTKGGEYFFVPGLAALRALASAYWR